MNKDLKNLFNDQEEYLTLFELSKSKKYSLEYLLSSANSGKLKAFKVGDDWLTTSEWFAQYQAGIKKEVDDHVESFDYDDNKWADVFPYKKFDFGFIPQMVLILFILSLVSFSLSWIAFHPSGQKTAIGASGIVNRAHVASAYFLDYTNKFYGTGAVAALSMVNNSITSVGLVYDLTNKAGAESLYIASVIDDKTDKYKISDELITKKIYELAGLIKNEYKGVAGASHIRQQIYYDEWQAAVEVRE